MNKRLIALVIIIILIMVGFIVFKGKKGNETVENPITNKEETVDLRALGEFIGDEVSNEKVKELITKIKVDYRKYLKNATETGDSYSEGLIIYFSSEENEDDGLVEGIISMINDYMETRKQDDNYGFYKVTTGTDSEKGQYIEIHKIREMTDEDIKKAVGYREDEEPILEDIEIKDIDGKNYSFTYKGKEFKVQYTTDNWKIIDSYKISNKEDITLICKKLIEIHPIHTSDLNSYRTAEDMASEWIKHNIAYFVLPDDSDLKDNAKDVDLDPKDSGKSLAEMYKDRTGKDFSLDK